MEPNSLIFSHLGNEKLFKFSEVVSVLTKADGKKAFGVIMLRKDFDFDYFFEALDRDTLIKFIDHSYLRTSEFLSKFEIGKLIKYSDKLNYWRFWDIIIDKIDEIKDEEIAEFLNKLHGSIGSFNVDQAKIENCIISIKDPKVALSILKNVKSNQYQKMFFKNAQVIEYLNKTATNKKITEICLYVDSENVWNLFFEKKSIKQYLLKMPINEAIEIARNTKVEAIESIILNRADFSLEYLDTYASQTGSKLAYKLLFKSEFWEPRDSLLKASEDKQWRNGMPAIVLKRDSVINYLASITNAPNLFSLISGCKSSDDITKFILSLSGEIFESEYLLDIIYLHEYNQEIFDLVLQKEKMSGYLNSLSDDALIALGKDCETFVLWKYIVVKVSIEKAIAIVFESKNLILITLVFDREDLKASPEELVSFAKQIEMYEVWKKILDIPEVIEFYDL